MKEATENFDLGAMDWGASDDDVKEVVKEVKKVEVKKVKVEHKKEKTENKGKKYDTYSYESKTKKVMQTYSQTVWEYGINKQEEVVEEMSASVDDNYVEPVEEMSASIDDYEEPVEEMSASMEDLVEEVSDKEDKPYTSYKYDKKKETTRERVDTFA